jgi:hypothetical protein
MLVLVLLYPQEKIDGQMAIASYVEKVNAELRQKLMVRCSGNLLLSFGFLVGLL